MKIWLKGEQLPREIKYDPEELWNDCKRHRLGEKQVGIPVSKGRFVSVRRIDMERTFSAAICDAADTSFPPPPRVPTMPSAEMAVIHDTDSEEARETPVGSGP